MRTIKREMTVYDHLETARLYANKRNRENPNDPHCYVWTNEANQYTIIPNIPTRATVMRGKGWRQLADETEETTA